MTEIAAEAPKSLLRWSVMIVPALLALGILSWQLAGSDGNYAWFASLHKPSLFPPRPIFRGIWTLLDVHMGVSLAMVMSAREAGLRLAALGAFAVQFAINLVWPSVFLAGHHVFAALILLGVLVAAVIVTMAAFRQVRPRAALLLVPYLAWVLFSISLVWQLYVTNPL